MEIPLSAVTGALRIGVQIAANQRRPVLEVYHELRNVVGPPQQYRYWTGSRLDQLEESSTRFQDVFVQFVLVNLGGLRAENITLGFDGKFDRNAPDGLSSAAGPGLPGLRKLEQEIG